MRRSPLKSSLVPNVRTAGSAGIGNALLSFFPRRRLSAALEAALGWTLERLSDSVR